MLKRARLLVKALEVMRAAKCAELHRTTRASFLAACSANILGTKRIVEIAMPLHHNLRGLLLALLSFFLGDWRSVTVHPRHGLNLIEFSSGKKQPHSKGFVTGDILPITWSTFLFFCILPYHQTSFEN